VFCRPKGGHSVLLHIVYSILRDFLTHYAEPESIELKVDGETDACSQGRDLNFEFKGFAVSGRVRSGDGSADGPAGFALSLLSAKDNSVVQTTKSSEGGA
jgi:hypothetical protein